MFAFLKRKPNKKKKNKNDEEKKENKQRWNKTRQSKCEIIAKLNDANEFRFLER